MATYCENMASHRDQIMEKTQKFQIVYVGLTNIPQLTSRQGYNEWTQTICAVEGTIFQNYKQLFGIQLLYHI